MLNEPNVSIQVQSVYIESQSQPDIARYVFAYTICIRNLGREPIQLMSRYWLITNSDSIKLKFKVKAWWVNNPSFLLEKNIVTPVVQFLKHQWERWKVIT